MHENINARALANFFGQKQIKTFEMKTTHSLRVVVAQKSHSFQQEML